MPGGGINSTAESGYEWPVRSRFHPLFVDRRRTCFHDAAPDRGDSPDAGYSLHVCATKVVVGLAASAASVHCWVDKTHMYNRRKPRTGEQFLEMADGRRMELEFYADVDLMVQTDAGEIPVTLIGCPVSDCLKNNPWSLNLGG